MSRWVIAAAALAVPAAHAAEGSGEAPLVLAQAGEGSAPDEWNALPESGSSATPPSARKEPARRQTSPADSERASATVEEELPPFDATPVAIDPRPRFELRLGVWMVEDAGRLRTTTPAIGLGVDGRWSERLRWDAGYLFTWVHDGTQRLNVLNLHHGVRARMHYAYPVGGAWLTAGAGPALFVTMNSGPESPLSIVSSGGVDAALGVETQVSERLVRFELGASARGLPRVLRTDLHAAMVIGF